MKKFFLALLACLMLIFASACGKENDTPRGTEPPTDEEMAAEETAVPEDLTYMQEHELKYSADLIRHYEVPAYQHLNESENVEFIPYGATANLDLAFLDLSEPDEEGYVVYTIGYTALINHEYSEKLINNEINGNSWVTVWFAEPTLMDKYTGTVFPSRDLTDTDSFEYYTDVEYDGKVYSVGYGEAFDGTWGDKEDHNGHICQRFFGTYEYFARVPAEYDGLCFAVDLNGSAEEGYLREKERGDELEEAYVLHEDEGENSLENYVFCDVAALFRERDMQLNGIPAPEHAENAEPYDNVPEYFYGVYDSFDPLLNDDRFYEVLDRYCEKYEKGEDTQAESEELVNYTGVCSRVYCEYYNTEKDKQIAVFLMDDQTNIVASSGLLSPGEYIEELVCDKPIAWHMSLLGESLEDGFAFCPDGLGSNPYFVEAVYSMDGEFIEMRRSNGVNWETMEQGSEAEYYPDGSVSVSTWKLDR